MDASQLFDHAYFPFTVSVMIMLGIGLLELVGLGLSSIDIHIPDTHADADIDMDGIDFFGWLGIGQVPLMVTLVSGLSIFGLAGIIGQSVLQSMLGYTLPLMAAVPSALVLTIFLLGFVSRGVAKIMPRDETTAIGLDELVWRKGFILQGNATFGNPARARVYDIHGTAHHPLVQPRSEGFILREGSEIRITSREGDTFYAENLDIDINPV